MQPWVAALATLTFAAAGCGRVGFELQTSAEMGDAATDGAPSADSGVEDAGPTDGGSATQDAAVDAGPISNCGVGRPGPSNTGFAPGTLTPSATIEVTVPGTVIENVDVTGFIRVDADDVTIRNFRIQVSSGFRAVEAISGAQNLTMEHGEISGTGSDGVFGENFTARCLNVHDVRRSFFLSGDATIEDNWIHDTEEHGVFARGSHAFAFRRNSCDKERDTGSCIFVNDDAPNNVPAAVEDNFLNGGGYTVYCIDSTVLRRNRFGRDNVFGIVSGPCVNATQWFDNVWDDDGTPAP